MKNALTLFALLLTGIAPLSASAAKADPALGAVVESASHGAWVQHFEKGMLVHLSERAPKGKAKLQSHEGSTFILLNEVNSGSRGRFLFQWRPPVSGIYDADLLKAILKEYPHDDFPAKNWPKVDGISEDEIMKLFRAHAEASPINLSGGTAVIYAMYRLDRYLGRPTDAQSRRKVKRVAYAKGYTLAISGDDRMLTLLTENEPAGSDDTDRYGGGRVFREGSWTAKR